MILVEVEVVATGKRATLPMDIAERLARLGTVIMPTPKADTRFAPPQRLPLSATWRNGTFVPGVPTRY